MMRQVYHLSINPTSRKKVANRKKASRSRSKTAGRGRKSLVRKSSARKAVGRKRSARFAHRTLAEGESPHVFSFSRFKRKSASRHVARKSSAHEIRTNIGLSEGSLTEARSLLSRLEKQGRITRS
jgi:hypothetical protein